MRKNYCCKRVVIILNIFGLEKNQIYAAAGHVLLYNYEIGYFLCLVCVMTKLVKSIEIRLLIFV